MPQLSSFYGIVIKLYRRDHPPPHFHAEYSGDEALIVISDGSVYAGWLPPRALRLVRTWQALHVDELRRALVLAVAHEEPRYDRPAAMTKLKKLPRVIAVEVLPPYALRVTFDDDVVREVDLAEELWGPAFEPLKDPAIFAQATVEGGTVVWPTGADVDPLVLHGDYPPAETRPDHRVG